MNRRNFITATSLAAGGALAGHASAQNSDSEKSEEASNILLSLKFGMCKHKGSIEEKFAMLQKLGYDGIELDSPGGQNKPEALAASKKLGIPIHGVVDSIHWRKCLSDPSAEVREQGLQGLLTAIRECHQVGGSAVLLVPGVAKGKITQKQAWDRSIVEIRKA
ncbi:MAG: sugar phosphate isomerase/epimerase family protein, partial [Akkermansiaceae bacterium]